MSLGGISETKEGKGSQETEERVHKSENTQTCQANEKTECWNFFFMLILVLCVKEAKGQGTSYAA